MYHTPCILPLETVNEVGPIVASNPYLIRRLAFMHVIPLARTARGVLPPQRRVHEDGASQETDGKEGQDRSVTWYVMGSIFAQVDVRRDNAIEVPPADHDSNNDASFVDAFDIVRAPRDRIWDGGIDPGCSEKGAHVLDRGVG